MPCNRDETGRFVKGKSGNPKGRKKLSADVKEMLKGAAPEAVQLLIATMKDGEAKPELRVKCAETILDRVYGKASQPIEGDVDSVIQIILGKEAAEYGS